MRCENNLGTDVSTDKFDGNRLTAGVLNPMRENKASAGGAWVG